MKVSERRCCRSQPRRWSFPAMIASGKFHAGNNRYDAKRNVIEVASSPEIFTSG